MLERAAASAPSRPTRSCPFASARSAGSELDGRVVQVLDDDADLSGFDIALFSAGAGDLARVGAAGSSTPAPP